jgi:hypothetical protein
LNLDPIGGQYRREKHQDDGSGGNHFQHFEPRSLFNDTRCWLGLLI